MNNTLFVRHAQIPKKIKEDFSGYEIGIGDTYCFLEGK